MKAPTITKRARGKREEAKAPPRGRTTASHKSQPKGSRYTPPIPREVKHSPRWYPYAILITLFLGVVTIILNYIGALPNSPSNWYTLGALIGIVAAALAATNYR